MFNLIGRNALITGATGGIGQAIAEALARAGARVAVTGTRETVLKELVAKLPDAVPLVCNLADSAAVEGLPKRAEEALGSLDILVNNAGITRDNLLMRMKDEDWDEVLKVDLTAAFRLMRAAVRPMMKRRWGRIISITSVVGATGNPGQANYAAAKAGLIGLTKAVAQEVASRNITANCVAPGFIATAMTDVLDEKVKAALTERIPAGRMGTPADIAAGVLYLSSEEASYITGQTLHINGGMAML